MKKPTLRNYRRTLQISVAVAFIVIPWLNHLRISVVYGNFLSFHCFEFPLADPLAVLQITLKNHYLSADLLVGAGIALALAMVLGTVFCSWICPFGLLSEWGQTVARKWKRRRKPGILPVHHAGFKIKLIIFTIGLSGFFIFSTTPVLNQLSMPAWYSRVFQFWFEQWHVSMAIVTIAAIIGVEAWAGRRLWCRYICPQSVLLCLSKQIYPGRLRVHFNPDTCIGKSVFDPCARACSLDLDPKTLGTRLETECINCGDCISVCNKFGKALTFNIIRYKNGA